MSFKAVSNQTVSQICQGAAQNVTLHAVLPFYLQKKKEVIFLIQTENGLG